MHKRAVPAGAQASTCTARGARGASSGAAAVAQETFAFFDGVIDAVDREAAR